MDTHLSLVSGTERLRQLYRLPLDGEAPRLLVIGDAAQAQQAVGASESGTRPQRADPDGLDALPAAAFDAVLLPGTLTSACVAAPGTNRLDPAQAPDELLARVRAALAPGGLVVGHLDQLASSHGLWDLLHGRWSPRALWRLRRVTGAAGCRRALQRAGFAEVQTYYVEPCITEPMALVPAQRQAARSHFLRATRRTRGLYTPPGYFARLLLARLGLGGRLQPQIFFWARRPC